MPDAGEVARMREAREQLDLAPLVIHDSYLINLAAADEALRRKSVAAYRGEIERALAIGADYLVAHPGSAKGQTIEQGIERIARSIAEAARGLAGGLMLLLENTAGSGSAIGSRFDELARIRELAVDHVDFEIGYCLDTAHSWPPATISRPRRACGRRSARPDAVLDLARVRVIHANDSKAPLGSRVDRHEHIGRGHIGEDGFRRILRHPKLRRKPFILETPIDEPGDDRRNIDKLKELSRRASSGSRRRVGQ